MHIGETMIFSPRESLHTIITIIYIDYSSLCCARNRMSLPNSSIEYRCAFQDILNNSKCAIGQLSYCTDNAFKMLSEPVTIR